MQVIFFYVLMLVNCLLINQSKLFGYLFLKENKVDSKIIIIGNKNDLNNDFIIDYMELITKYELSLNIYPKIFLLSAKKDNNFEEIMNIII